MPNVLEIQIAQKQLLYKFLLLERLNKDKNIERLSSFINEVRAGMSKEEIAYVEELVNQEVGN